MNRPIPLLAVLLLAAAPAFAQQSTAPISMPGVAGSPVPTPQKPADWDQRLAWSKKIHALRPASEQIQNVVNHLAQRVPAASREAFRQRILAAIDDRKLEEISTNAMAQTFTVPELQKMYDYDSSPEAKSIADKMPIYQQLVQPALMQMLDKAMMDARVGANSPGAMPQPVPGSAFYTQQTAPSSRMMSMPRLTPTSMAPTGH